MRKATIEPEMTAREVCRGLETHVFIFLFRTYCLEEDNNNKNKIIKDSLNLLMKFSQQLGATYTPNFPGKNQEESSFLKVALLICRAESNAGFLSPEMLPFTPVLCGLSESQQMVTECHGKYIRLPRGAVCFQKSTSCLAGSTSSFPTSGFP